MKRFFPPGFSHKSELKTLLSFLLFAILWSLKCPYEIVQSKSLLLMKTHPLRKAMMPHFHLLCDGALLGFTMLLLLAFSLIFAHYRYHRRGTMSIYLMKRLKNPWELHLRCLAAPIAAILIALILAAALLSLYYGIYLSVSPEGSVKPGQIQMLLESLKRIDFYF